MPTYVVAVDFSKPSRQMLDEAAARARAAHADVVLVHAFEAGLLLSSIYHDGAMDPIMELQQEMKLDEAIQFTTKWAQPLRDAGLQVATVAEEAAAADLILRVAKERDADMIIIARQGHRPVRDFFVGSTADAVVRKADRPVLVVRRDRAQAD